MKRRQIRIIAEIAMAFANAGVAAVHALAYPLGARYHLPHGLSNSMLLPYVTGSWNGTKTSLKS